MKLENEDQSVDASVLLCRRIKYSCDTEGSTDLGRIKEEEGKGEGKGKGKGGGRIIYLNTGKSRVKRGR